MREVIIQDIFACRTPGAVRKARTLCLLILDFLDLHRPKLSIEPFLLLQ